MSTRMRLRATVAVAVVCLIPVAACDDGGPTPTPTPTPAPQSSPAETALERQKRLDFEEAEKNYRTFIAEYNRVAKAGGADAATPVMKATAAGPYLAFYVGRIRAIKADRVHYTSGTEIGYVHPAAYSTTQLTLEVCEDGSRNKVLNSNGKQVSSGTAALRSLYARPIAGRWVVWNGDEGGLVKSCQS
jgi:hypothetical protein